MEKPYAFTHHVGGLGSGVHAHLARRCLDEIGARLHSKEGRGGDVLDSGELSRLQDDLEDDLPSGSGGLFVHGLAHFGYLLRRGSVIPCKERVQREHNVYLVSALPDGHAALEDLDGKPALRRGEAPGHRGHMELGGLPATAHHGSEIRIHAHGSRQRAAREIFSHPVGLLHKGLHGFHGISRMESRKVHRSETGLQRLLGRPLGQCGRNGGQ